MGGPEQPSSPLWPPSRTASRWLGVRSWIRPSATSGSPSCRLGQCPYWSRASPSCSCCLGQRWRQPRQPRQPRWAVVSRILGPSLMDNRYNHCSPKCNIATSRRLGRRLMDHSAAAHHSAAAQHSPIMHTYWAPCSPFRIISIKQEFMGCTTAVPPRLCSIWVDRRHLALYKMSMYEL